MLRISRLADYGTVVMTYIARKSEALYTARDIAEHTNLNLPTVSKLLKILTNAELLASIRGTKGGYRLNLAPENISVASIVEAIDGRIALTECSYVTGSHHCDIQSDCSIRGNWQLISGAVFKALDGISLAQLNGADMVPIVDMRNMIKEERQA